MAKDQPAEITIVQISEVQESPAFNGRRCFLTLRVLPEDVLVRLEEKQRASLEYFKDDLMKLNESLSSESELSPAEIELLDSICEVADASASATFRKLWRR